MKLQNSLGWESHCLSVVGRNILKTRIKVEISMIVWLRNSKLGLLGFKHTKYCTSKMANTGPFIRVCLRLLVRGNHVRFFSFLASACYVQRFQKAFI